MPQAAIPSHSRPVAEIRADESNNPEDEKENREMRPLQWRDQFPRSSPRVHDRQLSAGDARDGERGENEEQIFPRPSLSRR